MSAEAALIPLLEGDDKSATAKDCKTSGAEGKSAEAAPAPEGQATSGGDTGGSDGSQNDLQAALNAALQQSQATAASAEQLVSSLMKPQLPKYQGRVRSFSDKKGFGFIDCHATTQEFGRDVFIHRAQMVESNLWVGQEVFFEVELSKQGHPQARGVQGQGHPRALQGISEGDGWDNSGDGWGAGMYGGMAQYGDGGYSDGCYGHGGSFGGGFNKGFNKEGFANGGAMGGYSKGGNGMGGSVGGCNQGGTSKGGSMGGSNQGGNGMGGCMGGYNKGGSAMGGCSQGGNAMGGYNKGGCMGGYKGGSSGKADDQSGWDSSFGGGGAKSADSDGIEDMIRKSSGTSGLWEVIEQYGQLFSRKHVVIALYQLGLCLQHERGHGSVIAPESRSLTRALIDRLVHVPPHELAADEASKTLWALASMEEVREHLGAHQFCIKLGQEVSQRYSEFSPSQMATFIGGLSMLIKDASEDELVGQITTSFSKYAMGDGGFPRFPQEELKIWTSFLQEAVSPMHTSQQQAVPPPMFMSQMPGPGMAGMKGMQGMPSIQGMPGMQGMGGMLGMGGMQGIGGQGIGGMQGMGGMQCMGGMKGMQGMQGMPGMQDIMPGKMQMPSMQMMQGMQGKGKGAPGLQMADSPGKGKMTGPGQGMVNQSSGCHGSAPRVVAPGGKAGVKGNPKGGPDLPDMPSGAERPRWEARHAFGGKGKAGANAAGGKSKGGKPDDQPENKGSFRPSPNKVSQFKAPGPVAMAPGIVKPSD